MSVLHWLLKPKKEMARKGTKKVRIGKYQISSHAQNRVADSKRNVKKMDVVDNLLTKPLVNTATKTDEKGRKSYNRIGKTITASINPSTNVVVTVRQISVAEKKKHQLKRRKNGKYYR